MSRAGSPMSNNGWYPNAQSSRSASQSPRSASRSPRAIANAITNLNLTQKRKLLSLAKQLKAAINRKYMYGKQANNLLESSGITLQEFGMPSTAASRNIVRRYGQLENRIHYTHGHLVTTARKLARNFPTVAHMQPENIIRNTAESIRRHEKTLRNIHSGRYQIRGRGWAPRR